MGRPITRNSGDCVCPTGDGLGPKWYKFRERRSFGREITCRIYVTTLVFGFEKYLLRYSLIVIKFAEFSRKKCIPVEQLLKGDSPHLAGTFTIEKAARGYPIRP